MNFVPTFAKGRQFFVILGLLIKVPSHRYTVYKATCKTLILQEIRLLSMQALYFTIDTEYTSYKLQS